VARATLSPWRGRRFVFAGAPSSSAELYQPATLTPVGLVSIALAPASPSITAGASQQFIATGTFADSSTQQLASASWSTSDNTIATVTSDVSNYGTAFGVGPGTATLSACTGANCRTVKDACGPFFRRHQVSDLGDGLTYREAFTTNAAQAVVAHLVNDRGLELDHDAVPDPGKIVFVYRKSQLVQTGPAHPAPHPGLPDLSKHAA